MCRGSYGRRPKLPCAVNRHDPGLAYRNVYLCTGIEGLSRRHRRCSGLRLASTCVLPAIALLVRGPWEIAIMQANRPAQQSSFRHS